MSSLTNHHKEDGVPRKSMIPRARSRREVMHLIASRDQQRPQHLDVKGLGSWNDRHNVYIDAHICI